LSWGEGERVVLDDKVSLLARVGFEDFLLVTFSQGFDVARYLLVVVGAYFGGRRGRSP
jgi:hypothetical protein